MRDRILNKIYATITALGANSELTKEEFENESNRIKKLLFLEKIEEVTKDDISSKLEAISKNIIEDVKKDKLTLEQASPRFFSTESIKIIKEQLPKKVAFLSTAFAIAFIAYSCSSKELNNEDFVPTVNGNYISIESQEENVSFEPIDSVANIQTEEMSIETKEMADEIVLSMEDAILKGFKVTEDNKSEMARIYSEYYVLNKMNTLSDFEWGTIFPETTVSAKDLMNSKFALETLDEKRVTVSKKEGMLDYSLLFNDTDAKFLNNGASIIAKINSTSGTDRKDAVSEFYNYTIDNLTKTENRMQYSELALDTFRAVMFESFDQLTNHKVVDNELEHAINTVYMNCNSKTNVTVNENTIVADKNVTSLQSIFEIYMIEKLDERLVAGRDAIENKTVNSYDSIDEISKYVSEAIDLRLYKEIADYESYLNNLFLVSSPSKSKDDSGVSNGKGGTISNDQLNKYGIDPNSATAKADLEVAVQAEIEKNANANAVVKNSEGTIVGSGKSSVETMTYWVQKGATDCNNNVYNNTASPEYKASYNQGWNAANVSKQAAIAASKSKETTYTETINNGTTTTTETTTVIPYTGTPAVDPNVIITDEFVPVTETTDIYDYTSSINELNSLKNELFAMSSIYDDTKSIKM